MILLDFLAERITPLFAMTVVATGLILWLLDRREMEDRGLDREARLAGVLGAAYIVGILGLFIVTRLTQSLG